MGKWIGIGLADEHYVISGGTTLGSQVNGINASYFWQDTGIRRLQMFGEAKKDVHPLVKGDLVSVAVNFKLQRIYFYRNKDLQVNAM